MADESRGSKQPLGFQSRDMNVFKGVLHRKNTALEKEAKEEVQILMGRDIC